MTCWNVGDKVRLSSSWFVNILRVDYPRQFASGFRFPHHSLNLISFVLMEKAFLPWNSCSAWNLQWTLFSGSFIWTHRQLLTVLLFYRTDGYACIDLSQKMKFLLDNEVLPIANMTQAKAVIWDFLMVSKLKKIFKKLPEDLTDCSRPFDFKLIMNDVKYSRRSLTCTLTDLKEVWP